jgi:inositol 3-alpha-galactosyltransferase
MGPNTSALMSRSSSSKQQQQQAAEADAAASHRRRRAYVTFLAGDGDYWKGVVGLAKGLRKVRSAYPLVVAVLPDVPGEHRRELRRQGCAVREIQPVYPPESQTRFAMAYYVVNYSKLRIWEFVEYERIVYLDADIQVYGNIDHLLDFDDDLAGGKKQQPPGRFYAVMDCFCEKTWGHTPQHKIGYCQQCPGRVPWPEAELGPPPPRYFNAGMFVHEPSLGTARDLLDALAATPPTPFAEQDFLNVFFRDAYEPIPPAYNLVLAMLWRHPENVGDLDEVKVVHYCAAGSKPWRYTGQEPNMEREDVKMLVSKWWDIFNDETLDYKGPPVEEDDGDDDDDVVVREPLRQALAEGAGAANYFPAPSAA